jgi:hypothetical protein
MKEKTKSGRNLSIEKTENTQVLVQAVPIQVAL